ATQNNTFTYAAPAGAKTLIVVASSRMDSQNILPTTLTYGGVPLVAVVNSEGTASTYVNSHIYYLHNPPSGSALPLVVNWGAAPNTTFAVDAFKPLVSPGPVPINLPLTNFTLPAGTKLSLNAPGANVIGAVSATGDASIIAGATAPTLLTIGGIGGTGVGTLAISNNLGL